MLYFIYGKMVISWFYTYSVSKMGRERSSWCLMYAQIQVVSFQLHHAQLGMSFGGHVLLILQLYNIK